MKVKLPIVFRTDESLEHGLVQQIARPSTAVDAAVTKYEADGVSGHVLSYKDDSDVQTEVLATREAPRCHSAFDRCLIVGDLPVDLDADVEVDLRGAGWHRHPDTEPAPPSQSEYRDRTAAVLESWRDAFSYTLEDPTRGVAGLRPPQRGAIQAVSAHWTASTETATVVLPTGVGKTETMLSLFVVERCERLLLVVPTDALRTQIGAKFLTLGLLKEPVFGVVAAAARYPVVGLLKSRPKEPSEVEAIFRRCNVVVTTMQLASGCSAEVTEKMAELCTHLFIDEAHHVAAPKWNEFKVGFSASRIVQFTATPFRNDGKPIGGHRVYTFPLRYAQEQDYFKKIHFKQVIEFDADKRDQAIAEAAIEQLHKESHLGHILMARVGSIARAAEVFEIYKKYGEFNPVQIHSQIKTKAARDQIRRQLTSGHSKIVVCVDMLGEGFDLPELKIAAFHDIRKSLASTLQLAGRFTRSRPDLGDATFIANLADLEVRDEIAKLYQQDPDWNVLLPDISEKANEDDSAFWNFLKGFHEPPGSIPLSNVRPSMSTVVYRTKCADWAPLKFGEGIAGFQKLDKTFHWLNHEENVLIVVTMKRDAVDWARVDDVFNWDWQLYVLHWSPDLNLLFIHNSSNAGVFKKLAKAVAGESAEQISGPPVFRCLAGVNRLKLQNVGLLERGRIIRYTMRAGSDVEAGISETQKRKAIKANLFGQGFAGGYRTTIGCSYKGRIWSYRNANLKQLTEWCRGVGEKLVDESLDPETVLNGTLVPTPVSRRPAKMPIAVEWPDVFYNHTEASFGFKIGQSRMQKCDTDLELVDPSTEGGLYFAVSSDLAKIAFELVLSEVDGMIDFSVRPTDGAEAAISLRSKTQDLASFFEENPPTFWFADGSSLTGFEYVELRKPPDTFPRDRIEAWDWTGTNIRSESQDSERKHDSIQYRVVAELKSRNYTVIYDDDGAGEMADVVAVREESTHILIEFWHCKYSKEDKPGARIDDLYVVCGQAQNSIRWLEKVRDLFTHLMRREPRRYLEAESTRFDMGNMNDLARLRSKAEMQPIKLVVYVVQPGLSKRKASEEQLELLAVTENYLLETFEVAFGVIASP